MSVVKKHTFQGWPQGRQIVSKMYPTRLVLGATLAAKLTKMLQKTKTKQTSKIGLPQNTKFSKGAARPAYPRLKIQSFLAYFWRAGSKMGPLIPKWVKIGTKLPKNSPKGLLENDIVTNISDHKSTSLAQLPVACTSRFPVVSPLA